MEAAQCSTGSGGEWPLDEGSGSNEGEVGEGGDRGIPVGTNCAGLSYGEIADLLTTSGMKMSASSVHNYMHAAYKKFAIIVLAGQNGGRQPTTEEVEELAVDPEFHEAVGECLQIVFKGEK